MLPNLNLTTPAILKILHSRQNGERRKHHNPEASEMLKSIFRSFSQKSRRARAEILNRRIKLRPEWRILDLGGGTGEHINRIFPEHKNVVVCDILEAELAIARSKFGYETVALGEDASLPFSDTEFEFVFCSSVIEHVTGPKDEVVKIQDGSEFKATARRFQKSFSSEIRRISKRYYVQTPHRYFIIESHSWLPIFIIFFSRSSQKRILEFFGKSKFWPKATEPDWNLLTPKEVSSLFPDANILIEKSFGLPKSIMAIKT
jgi:ubiquinone/menaquinone biosynthesis C-methylase UbiE